MGWVQRAQSRRDEVSWGLDQSWWWILEACAFRSVIGDRVWALQM